MDRCPTCNQPLASHPRIRMCRRCGKVMARHDKFIFVTEGGASYLEHRHCDNPTDYMSLEERKAYNER